MVAIETNPIVTNFQVIKHLQSVVIIIIVLIEIKTFMYINILFDFI